jgi:hypothetical protein
MSQKNGVEMSWEQWSNHVGSVIAIDFGLDIGLSEAECPGLSGDGQYNFVVTANFVNTNPTDTVAYDAYVVAVQEGTMLIETNHAMLATGVVTRQDVISSLNAPEVPFVATEKIYGGGSFWGDLKKFASSAFSAAKSAPKYIKEGIQLAKDIAPYAQAARSFVGVGGRGRRRKRGGVLVGGTLARAHNDFSEYDCEEEYEQDGLDESRLL